MNHTNEKLEVGLGTENDSTFSQSPYQDKVAANMDLVAICYGKNKIANARRLVACWNSHDMLVEACKELMEMTAGPLPGFETRARIKRAERAIAEAEKGK